MAKNASIDLTSAQQETIQELLKHYLPNTEVWAYGSRVRWTSNTRSDLDLVVFSSPEQDIAVAELREAFEESNLPFRVDLFVWDQVSDSFQKQIEQEHVVLIDWPKQVENWTKFSLQECIVMNQTKYSPNEKWPFVNYLETGKITDNRIDEIKFLVLDKDKLPSSARQKVRPGDILYSKVRPNKRHFGLIGNIPENFLVSTGFVVFRAQENIADTRFIYWFLTQDRIVDYLQSIAEQSASVYPSIRPADIKGLDINLPPLSEQRTIAHILSTLDHKIELNRQMNQTLEAMAQAIFKDWFVDFGPVRAKMEGRDPYLPLEIWAMFPDRFVNSDLGETPEGWVPAGLDRVATIIKGRSYRSEELAPSETALVTLKSFARGGGYRPNGLKPFCGTYKTEQVVHPGEVIVACTDVTQTAEVVGRSAIVGETLLYRNLVASLDVLIIRPKNSEPSRCFIYYLTGTDSFVAHNFARTTGTTVLHLSKNAVASFQFALPKRRLLQQFENIVGPIQAYIQTNAIAVDRLTELRNNLLPKLLSGEIQFHESRLKI